MRNSFRICVCWLGMLIAAVGAELKPDAQLLFFPTLGQRTDAGLEFEVHGWVFEPGNSKFRRSMLRRAVGIHEDELSAAEKATFSERTQLFLEDNERHKTISILLAGQAFTLPPSGANGHFTSRLQLTRAQWEEAAGRPGFSNGVVTFQSVPKDERIAASGAVHVLEDTGLSVISDIDDTIKVSNVREKKELLRNTFCRPFRPVAGMPGLYRDWANSAGARFHYVSASPWQLYSPLSQFVQSNGFPAGTFHLKFFRLKEHTFLDWFAPPDNYKRSVIEPMLERFPRRRFVLVGDSGEKDPEIYGALARAHPQQVVGIFIHDVTGQPADAKRYRRAFAGVPETRWRLFKTPDEIKNATLLP